MDLLTFCVLLLIRHRSKTEGAFFVKLLASVNEFGFNIAANDLTLILEEFIIDGWITEIRDTDNEGSDRLFFSQK